MVFQPSDGPINGETIEAEDANDTNDEIIIKVMIYDHYNNTKTYYNFDVNGNEIVDKN